MNTGQGLAEYAISKLGTPYFYGSKMDVLTEKKMAQMHSYYPSVVTKNYMEIARRQAQVGKINVDCSGLIGAYRGRHIGSSQLYSTAKRRMPMASLKDFAIGTVLWKSGHVGVYIGDGYCVEAKGIRYGTVKTPVKNTAWTCGLTFADMAYSYDKTVIGTSKQNNPYNEPKTLVKLGDKGTAVKWVQYELVESGFDIAIDGSFGQKTFDAVMRFQRSSKIEVDGIVGPETRKHFKL